ncbi:MAG: hypothetical protein WC273_10995 [Dehalococcoidia bacterium]
MSENAHNRIRAIVLFAAPLLLIAGFLLHPYVTNETDLDEIARLAGADPGRWAAAHVLLVIAVASALLAATSLRHLLRDAGEERWSFLALGLVLAGGTMIAGAIGGEIAVAAAAQARVDVRAVLEAGEPWFTPLFLASCVLFALGWLCFGAAFYRSRMLSTASTRAVVAGTVLLTAGLFIPATWGGYLSAVGLAAVTWTAGVQAWTHAPMPAAPGRVPRSA